MSSNHLPPCQILVRLTREWEVLRMRPTSVVRASGWGLGVPVHSLDDVLTAVGMPRTAADRAHHPAAGARDVQANAVLGRLVAAAHHDDLAARVVLQRLLPGIIAAARRRARTAVHLVERERAVEELVGAAWTVIRTFPVERRNVHVAAQLLRDTEYHVYVRPSRRMLVQEPTTADRLEEALVPDRGDDGVDDPRDELATLASMALLSDHDRVLLDLLTAGRPVHEVARELKISERSVRNHRQAVISRLRQAAYALAAA